MTFKVPQIRIFKKLYLLLFHLHKRLLKNNVASPSCFFASNNIAQYTGDSAQQLKAADNGDYVVMNTVTLRITGRKYEQLHYGICALSANTIDF